MQLALNIAVFIVGFCLAGIVQDHPKQLRSILNSLIQMLHYVCEGGILGLFSSQHVQHRIFEQEPVQLLTRSDVEQKYTEGTWQREAYNGTSMIVLGKDKLPKFPCVYATAGMRHNEHRWLFMPSLDFNSPKSIRMAAAALRTYLPASEKIGPNTSLIIVFPPDKGDLSVASYQDGFWKFLRGLRTADTKPWPEDIPSQTESPKFTFCFDGIPAFLAAMTPAHEARASRHAPNFVIAVQPRWVFDNLFATPEKRRSAVDKVRNLIPAYDSIELSPDLSAYGQEGTTESHQFYLLDKNETALCPFPDMDG